MAERIKCRCPHCRRSYRVPPSAAGHRAHCHACGGMFRLVEEILRPPTDEDVLRWLLEAEEDEDRPDAEPGSHEDGRFREDAPPASARPNLTPDVIPLHSRVPRRDATASMPARKARSA